MARAPEDTAPVDQVDGNGAPVPVARPGVDGNGPDRNGVVDATRTVGAGSGAAFRARLPILKEKRLRSPRTPKLRPTYERNYRQTIRRVDLWTVLKLSICFYLTALVVLLVAGVVLWWIASATGVIGNVENFIGDLVNSEDFEFLSWSVLRASALVGLVIVCLLVVWTVVAASLYNLFSGILGGIEITVVEEESIVSK